MPAKGCHWKEAEHKTSDATQTITSRAAHHSYLAGQIIIGTFSFGLPFHEMIETKFLPVLVLQIILMHKPEKFFFPNGRNFILPLPSSSFKHLREATIIDIAGSGTQVTQYSNHILHPSIVTGNVLVSDQHFIIGLVSCKVLHGEFFVQYIHSIHLSEKEWLLLIIADSFTTIYLCKGKKKNSYSR